jgi:hypothetical protein
VALGISECCACHHSDPVGELPGICMKAVLEFNYPDDERKLKDALNGTSAIDALFRILTIIGQHGIKPNDKIKEIKELADTTLRNGNFL